MQPARTSAPLTPGPGDRPSKLVMRVRFPFARSNPKPQVMGHACQSAPAVKTPWPFLRARRVPLPCHCGSAAGPQRTRVRAVAFDVADLLVKLLTMTTLPLGEVKTHLSELVGRVHDHHETLTIMRDADTMRRLATSDAELARGEEVTAAELAETIRDRSAHE